MKIYRDFQTRGNHGHLYSKWIIPQIGVLPEEEASRMSSSLDKMYQGLREQLLCPLSKLMIHLPESSVGLTTSTAETAHLSPIVLKYMQDRDNQANYQSWLSSLQFLNSSVSMENSTEVGKDDGEDDDKEDGDST